MLTSARPLQICRVVALSRSCLQTTARTPSKNYSSVHSHTNLSFSSKPSRRRIHPLTTTQWRTRLACTSEMHTDNPSFQELSVQELSTMLKSPSKTVDVQFVDVREPAEVQIASLPLFKTFPLGLLLKGGENELDPDKQTIVLCHHGRRSVTASLYLLERGFRQVFNVTGGIDQFSKLVDPSVPLY